MRWSPFWKYFHPTSTSRFQTTLTTPSSSEGKLPTDQNTNQTSPKLPEQMHRMQTSLLQWLDTLNMPFKIYGSYTCLWNVVNFSQVHDTYVDEPKQLLYSQATDEDKKHHHLWGEQSDHSDPQSVFGKEACTKWAWEFIHNTAHTEYHGSVTHWIYGLQQSNPISPFPPPIVNGSLHHRIYANYLCGANLVVTLSLFHRLEELNLAQELLTNRSRSNKTLMHLVSNLEWTQLHHHCIYEIVCSVTWTKFH